MYKIKVFIRLQALFWFWFPRKATLNRAPRKIRDKADRYTASCTSPDSRLEAQNPPTGGEFPSSTKTDPPGSARTEEVNEAVAPGHSMGTQEGLPSADDHVKGDLGDRQESGASERPSLKR